MSAFRGGHGSGGPPKGHFQNGVWQCDCNPRLPAVHFETKKEGPNKGRWFRCCQKPKADAGRCKFFLWDDQAQPRERNALASNSRTESGPANPTTPSRRQPSPPPPYTIESAPSASSRKRTRSIIEDLDDDYGFRQVDDDELNKVMTQIETPSKAARTTTFSTPGASRRTLPWKGEQPGATSGNGLQTPQTERRTPGDPFASRHPAQSGTLFTPSKIDEDETQLIVTPSSSFDVDATPTPGRFKNMDLVTDVFGFLQGANVRLNSHAEIELKQLLSKHARNAEGYRRGRDVSRTTVKAKEAKITELTYRVNTLEAELEAEKATVRHLQWEAENDSLDA